MLEVASLTLGKCFSMVVISYREKRMPTWIQASNLLLKKPINVAFDKASLWLIHNPDFNYGEFAVIKSQARLNRSKISVK